MTDYIRLKIICEGQAEETFVSKVLYDKLALKGIYCIPFRLITSVKSKTYRGGIVSYAKAKKDILRALNEKEAYVTTMFDYYKLSKDFPGKDEASGINDPYGKVEIIENSMAEDIGDRRFIPYIQLHEFESLLFSDIDSIDRVMKLSSGTKINELRSVISAFQNPEGINDGENTAPSKRLIRLYPSYQKITDGVLIADLVAAGKMRDKCRHFNGWLDKIENLSRI
ncbi:DUF4276 family protein [Methanoplanus limicola]|uniref:DUF4276 family protein n=1 Tax=Methanoplanus limicola DSM 2279 TaxID=937775 RepID=H1YZG8_9EURY|nr:DUF4276 family protein [Methanoplanus limicola]EHQ36077.1 hypothetical protein Metlim_1988 [Methanoplanus limicola DSM 2279]